jgi:hypothetical protein
MEDDRIDRLARAVCGVAYDGSEILWDSILDVVDTYTARSLYRTLKCLVDGGEYIAAMNIVIGLFDLCEVAIPNQVDTCNQSPALMRMFLDEFLEESDEFLFVEELSKLSDQLDSQENSGV